MLSAGSPPGGDDTTGIIFNIQRYSIQDGPGIRTTVFLKGCPLRCTWCSNPESQHFWPEIAHRDSLCNRCGRCVEVCTVRAISLTRSGIRINRELCTNCGECVAACLPGAIKVFGQEMSVEEVFRIAVKDVEYYRNSGGGVTASGGEPLCQPAFVVALFRRCRDVGIHTTLDTTACVSAVTLEGILPHTSLVLCDLKHGEPAAHRRWTHRSNKQVVRNLRLIARSGTPLVVRVPLIPGVNDSDEELLVIARTLVDILGKSAKVNLLPYHRYGAGKYQMLDRRYRLPRLVRQTDAEVQRAKETMESLGLECEIVL